MARNLPMIASSRRALAILDRLIAEAEREARHSTAHPAARGDPALARNRVALLRHSRRCLLTGEPPGVAANAGAC